MMDFFDFVFGIVPLLIAFPTLLVCIWGTRKLVFRWREALAFDRTWPRATATVTSVGSEANLGVEIARTGYTFTAPDGQTYTGGDYEHVIENPVVGLTAEVMYNPEDPSENHPAGKIVKRIAVWAAMFIVLLAVLYGAVGFCILMSIDSFRDVGN